VQRLSRTLPSIIVIAEQISAPTCCPLLCRSYKRHTWLSCDGHSTSLLATSEKQQQACHQLTRPATSQIRSNRRTLIRAVRNALKALACQLGFVESTVVTELGRVQHRRLSSYSALTYIQTSSMQTTSMLAVHKPSTSAYCKPGTAAIPPSSTLRQAAKQARRAQHAQCDQATPRGLIVSRAHSCRVCAFSLPARAQSNTARPTRTSLTQTTPGCCEQTYPAEPQRLSLPEETQHQAQG
jgi:hypothetical protein